MGIDPNAVGRDKQFRSRAPTQRRHRTGKQGHTALTAGILCAKLPARGTHLSKLTAAFQDGAADQSVDGQATNPVTACELRTGEDEVPRVRKGPMNVHKDATSVAEQSLALVVSISTST